MSAAKNLVGSAAKRIFTYVAEIIMSAVLLVVICLPLAFAIPMWIQYIIFRVPAASLALNPVSWFGFFGTLAIMVLLAAASVIVGYMYVIAVKPKTRSAEERKGRPPKEEKVEIEAETLVEEEEIAADVEETAEEEETEGLEADEGDS